jgi:hypothetical protein
VQMIGATARRLYHLSFLFISFCIILWCAPPLSHYLGEENQCLFLAGGRQILFGRFNFFYFLGGGPFKLCVEAIGLAINNSLISETLVCSLGFSVSIFFIHYISHRYVSRSAGIVLPFLALYLLPYHRFFRWDHWLLPLVLLFFFHGFLNTKGAMRKLNLLFIGFAIAMAWLDRIDFGIVFLFFSFTGLVAVSCRSFNLKTLQSWIVIVLLGFFQPILLWCIFLVFNGGNFLEYLDVSIRHVFSIVTLPILPSTPFFDMSNPFSVESGTALLFILIPLSFMACILFGGWFILRKHPDSDYKNQFMVLIGIFGMGLLPATMYYPNTDHVLSKLPLLLIAVGMLVRHIFRKTLLPLVSTPWLKKIIIACSVLYLIALGMVVFSLRGLGGMVFFSANPIPKLKELSRENYHGIDHPTVHITSEIQRITLKGDSILLISGSLDSQILFFSNRRSSAYSGVINPYFFHDPKIEALDYLFVEKNPPSIVIVHSSFFLADKRLMQGHTPLFEYISQNYPRIVYDNYGYKILAKLSTDV